MVLNSVDLKCTAVSCSRRNSGVSGRGPGLAVGMSSAHHQVVLLFVLVVMAAVGCEGYAHRLGNVETNEISPDGNDIDLIEIANEIEIEEAPVHERTTCKPHTICAYVQANARGIQVQPLCRCPGQMVCPLAWDSLDGHSITQGSNQYKFCEHPKKLSVCTPDEMAYTVVTLENKFTGEASTYHRMFCVCPETSHYVMANIIEDDANDYTDRFQVIKSCKPLPPCQPDSDCKVISESASTFYVNNHCICPAAMSCPSLARQVFRTEQFGRGFQHHIRCQH